MEEYYWTGALWQSHKCGLRDLGFTPTLPKRVGESSYKTSIGKVTLIRLPVCMA